MILINADFDQERFLATQASNISYPPLSSNKLFNSPKGSAMQRGRAMSS